MRRKERSVQVLCGQQWEGNLRKCEGCLQKCEGEEFSAPLISNSVFAVRFFMLIGAFTDGSEILVPCYKMTSN